MDCVNYLLLNHNLMNVQALAQHYNRVIWFSDRLLGCCYAVLRVFCDIVFWALLESFGCLLGCSGWLPGYCLSLHMVTVVF